MITLVCVASGGDPPPTLIWVRPGGEDLPKRSVINGGTLTIPAITVDDGGAYSCMASNNVGNPAKKSANLLVRGMTLNLNLYIPKWQLSPYKAGMRSGLCPHSTGKQTCIVLYSARHQVFPIWTHLLRFCSQLQDSLSPKTGSSDAFVLSPNCLKPRKI